MPVSIESLLLYLEGMADLRSKELAFRRAKPKTAAVDSFYYRQEIADANDLVGQLDAYSEIVRIISSGDLPTKLGTRYSRGLDGSAPLPRYAMDQLEVFSTTIGDWFRGRANFHVGYLSGEDGGFLLSIVVLPGFGSSSSFVKPLTRDVIFSSDDDFTENWQTRAGESGQALTQEYERRMQR